jgi:hypothetical protein
MCTGWSRHVFWSHSMHCWNLVQWWWFVCNFCFSCLTLKSLQECSLLVELLGHLNHIYLLTLPNGLITVLKIGHPNFHIIYYLIHLVYSLVCLEIASCLRILLFLSAIILIITLNEVGLLNEWIFIYTSCYLKMSWHIMSLLEIWEGHTGNYKLSSWL